jgi:hypothetical protein
MFMPAPRSPERKVMTTRTNITRNAGLKTMIVCLKIVRAARLLPLLLLAFPVVGEAQYTYVTNNGTITITSYTGSDGALTVPDTINSLPVTGIGDGAFNNCTNLTCVTMGNSVITIGRYAFYQCTNLINIAIADGVTNIGDMAFFGCINLASITIGNHVSDIGENAFYGCAKLTSVTIPDSVERLGYATFAYCTSLANVRLGDGLKGIQSEMFEYSGLTSVAIPDSITGIGLRSFQYCYSLTNVTIGNGVNEIGSLAFRNCTNLIRVMIGNSVTTVGDYSFLGCSSLVGVTIPDSVINIGNSAFSDCTSLTSVMIGNGITNIGGLAFYNCVSLMAITVDTNNPVFSSFDGVLFNKSQSTLLQCPAGKAGNYTVPNSVTSFGNNAFFLCPGLTSITIGNTINNIGTWTFAYCSSLTAIMVDTNNPVYSSVDGVMFNKAQTSLLQFPGGKGGSYTVPDSVTNISAAAFNQCSRLTNVTLPNGVTSLENGMFNNCTNLTGVYFLGNAPSVSWSIFDNDNNVTAYYLPGTTGWGQTFGGRPTALWRPQVQSGDGSYGVKTNQFGFNINWASGMSVVVEACTNLTHRIWTPVGTNTLTGGSSYFSDSQWTNYPRRFYRLRSP